MRPDLPRGRVDSIDGVRDVGDPTSNQTRIRSMQPLHHRSIGYQLIEVDLCTSLPSGVPEPGRLPCSVTWL